MTQSLPTRPSISVSLDKHCPNLLTKLLREIETRWSRSLLSQDPSDLHRLRYNIWRGKVDRIPTLSSPMKRFTGANRCFLDSLKLLLLDEDNTVRQSTTEVFSILAAHNVGRNGFLHSEVIVPLSKLLDDPVDACRRNVHRAFELLSEFPDGSAGLVEAQLIAQFVLKLKTELEEIQELILDTLHFCLREEASQALNAGAVTVLKEKLSHSSVPIRNKAARALMGIMVPLEGKNKACEEGVIPLLVQLLKDKDAEVRANAAGALMNATITTKGKYAALHAEAITALLPLVDDQLSKVRLNAIKALTMMSEASAGRKILLEHVNKLRGRLNDPSEAVKRATEILIQVIQWKP